MTFPGVKSIGNFDSVRSNFVNGRSSIPNYINFNSDVPVTLELTGTETTETFFDTATDFSTNQKSISASEFVQGATFEYFLCINTSETTPVEVGLMLIDTDNTSKICNTQIQGGGDTLVKFILRVVRVTDDTTTKFFWSGYIFGDTTPVIDDENVTTPDRSKNTNFYPLLYANAGSGGNANNLTIKNFYFRRIC
jgi:hypothetical protein